MTVTDKKSYPMMQRDAGHAKPMSRKGRPGEKDKAVRARERSYPQFPHSGQPATNSDEASYRANDMNEMLFYLNFSAFHSSMKSPSPSHLHLGDFASYSNRGEILAYALFDNGLFIVSIFSIRLPVRVARERDPELHWYISKYTLLGSTSLS